MSGSISGWPANAECGAGEVDSARKLAREQFDSGLASEMEFRDVERAWMRSEAAQRLSGQGLMLRSI